MSEPFDPASVETTWDDLEPARVSPDKELQLAYARAFRGQGGAAVLASLKAMAHLDSTVTPAHSTETLWFVEGQRSVVKHILAMINRAKA